MTGISKERSIEKKKAYAAKIADLNMKRASLPAFYSDEIYKAIEMNANSSNALNNAIAVLLATGSRFIEVLKVSEYSIVDERTIKVHGVAKNEEKDFTVTRPLNGLTAVQVVDLVGRIRSVLNLTGSNAEITDRYHSQASRLADGLFKDRKITLHKLRYIASNLAYLTYGNGAVENTWVQKYLGHASGDTTKTYQCINVALRNPVDEAPAVVVQNVKYPEFINPKHRTTKEKKIELLTALHERAHNDGVKLTYSMLKKDYRFGSSTIDAFRLLYIPANISAE
jgi:integrase